MANGFNFARAPFTNERAPRLGFALALAFVVGLTVAHGYVLTGYLLREQEELDLRVEAIRQESEEANRGIAEMTSSLSQERTAVGNEQTRFLTQIYRRKSFSWTGLFNELEHITPGAVRVTSIAPQDEDEEITVTMTIVGRALEDILEMVRALESSSFFATVFPIDESTLDELAGRGTGVAATLRLRYVEDRRPEVPEVPEVNVEDDEETMPAEPVGSEKEPLDGEGVAR